MGKSIHTSINLSPELEDEINRLAKIEHVSLNAKINQIIELGLDRSEGTTNATEELKKIKTANSIFY